jgi:cell division control protein 7
LALGSFIFRVLKYRPIVDLYLSFPAKAMATARAPQEIRFRGGTAQEMTAWKNQFGVDRAPRSRTPKPQQSDYEEEEVDESVREDMTKLEDTFPGISDRFRLVNRIGEGISSCGCL